jgi:hypothetical protein
MNSSGGSGIENLGHHRDPGEYDRHDEERGYRVFGDQFSFGAHPLMEPIKQ